MLFVLLQIAVGIGPAMAAPRRALALVLALALLVVTSACSNVMLTYEREGSGHVSARTMDWSSDLLSEVTTFPRGTPLAKYSPYGSASAAANSTSAGRDTAEIGFVAATLKALHGVVADGLNEHGFGVGLLWMEHPALLNGIAGMGVGEFRDYYPSFDAADPRPAMAFMDLGGHLLSSCKTIADAETMIRKYQIVATDKNTFPAYFGFCGTTPECNPSVHFTLHDADGKSAVVEFIGEASKAASPKCFSDPAIGGTAAPNGGRVCFYDNTDSGVMTNEPTLETHRRSLQTQLDQEGNTNKALFGLLQNEFGGYQSSARFARLSVLNTLGKRASPTCASPASCGWSNTKYLDTADKLQHPHGFSFESKSATVDRVVQAARQIQTAVRPYGINVVDPVYGATQWTVIRDHSNKRFLFNSPAAPSFRSLDLASLDLTARGVQRSIPLANQEFDFEDASASLTAGGVGTKHVSLSPSRKKDQVGLKVKAGPGAGCK